MKYTFLFLLTFTISTVSFGKQNKTYVVELGNTMYSIAKQFNITIEALSKANNNLQASDLKLGQELIIPDAKKTEKKTISKHQHIVQAKETLYSISKKHDLSVEELKQWNKIQDNHIAIGDTLVVALVKANTINKNNVVLNTEPTNKQLTVLEKDTNIVVPKHPLFDIYQQQTEDKALVKDEVTVAMMTTTNPAMKYAYYALHKTAAVGTILKITNLANGKVSYAKVISKLPEIDENKNLEARISLGVVNQLKTGSGKAYVKIEYAKQ